MNASKWLPCAAFWFYALYLHIYFLFLFFREGRKGKIPPFFHVFKYDLDTKKGGDVMDSLTTLLYEYEALLASGKEYGCTSELDSLPVLLATPNATEKNASYTGALGRIVGRYTGCCWVSTALLSSNAPIFPLDSCVKGILKHQRIRFVLELQGSHPEQKEDIGLYVGGGISEDIVQFVEMICAQHNLKMERLSKAQTFSYGEVGYMVFHLHSRIRNPEQYALCSRTFYALYAIVYKLVNWKCF